MKCQVFNTNIIHESFLIQSTKVKQWILKRMITLNFIV
jgi:hypothetical protein